MELFHRLPPDAQALVRRFTAHPATTALWSSRRWLKLWGIANDWYPDWQERRDAILERGLPARILGAELEGEFLSVHLNIEEVYLIRPHNVRGFQLHITIGYKTDWADGFAESGADNINGRWRGREVVLKISWFGSGGTAFLAEDDDLAMDYDLAWLYARGWYSDRGLHVSL